MKAGSAAASAMTSTSLGPAGMSMATIASLFWSSIFAAVTYWLPGPSILCTCNRQQQGLTVKGIIRMQDSPHGAWLGYPCPHKLASPGLRKHTRRGLR